MKIEIPGWIHALSLDSYDGTRKVSYHFFSWKEGGQGYVPITPHTVTAFLPDDIDPTEIAVRALKIEREKIVEEFSSRTAKIDQQLQKLLALTNEVTS